MDDTTKPEQHEHHEQHEPDGQVSELAPSGDAPDEISSGDSVAGQPDQESGDVQEGTQGPNAIPDDPTGEHPHKP